MTTNNGLSTDEAGNVRFIPGIGLIVPGSSPPTGEWKFIALPQINESKAANYADVPIIGRSSPIPTYSGSNYRRFAITFHLHSISDWFKNYNIAFIRAIASLTHPEYQNTYRPPRIAWFRCGKLVAGFGVSTSGASYVRIVVEDYSLPMDPEQVWLDDMDLIPQYIALAVNVRVVYSFQALPGADDVLGGRY